MSVQTSYNARKRACSEAKISMKRRELESSRLADEKCSTIHKPSLMRSSKLASVSWLPASVIGAAMQESKDDNKVAKIRGLRNGFGRRSDQVVGRKLSMIGRGARGHLS